MKPRTSFVTFALALLVSAATLAPGQEPKPSPAPRDAAPAGDGADKTAAEKATVYIYRPKKLVGAALEPSVFCDDAEIGRMDNGRYVMLRLDPGEHRFHMTQEYKRVDEKLHAGQVLYLHVRIEMGAMKGRGAIFLADEDDALKELKKLKPLGADKLKDSKTVVGSEEAEAETKKRVEQGTAKHD
jgi:hypothetical protein